MATDQLNWTSEGIYGGAYSKVFRWSFERQGEFQSPLVTNGGPGDGTIVSPGRPPDKDVYIDDGRAGEYQFQPVHWHDDDLESAQRGRDHHARGAGARSDQLRLREGQEPRRGRRPA